jgi:hypothetical protein
MLKALLHRLLIAVTLVAFVSGMTLQLMPPKAAFAATGIAKITGDCLRMAMSPQDADSDHAMPCKGMDPECIKQMGCLGTPNLPLRLSNDFFRFGYGKVVYSTPATFRAGRSIKPDLLPPIGL